MIGNLLFNCICYLFGFIFLTILGPFLPHYRHIMAFITGTALWGVLCSFFMILQIPITPLTSFSGMILIIGGMVIINRAYVKTLLQKETLHNEALSGIVWFQLFLIVSMVGLLLFSPHFLYDEAVYIATGKTIAANGTFPPRLPGASFFLNARMSLVPSLLAGGYLFGDAINYSLFPVFAVYLAFFILIVSDSFFLTFGLSVPVRACFILFGAALIFSTPHYFFQYNYIHTNLPVAVYFFGTITGFLMYFNEKKYAWLILSGIFSAAASLTRIEMIFFNFIPLAIIFSSCLMDKKGRFIFMAVFLILSYSWHLYRLWFTGIEKGFHNFGLFELATLPFIILIWGLSANRKIYEYLFRFTLSISISLLVVIIVYFGVFHTSFLQQALSKLGDILFHQYGRANWGYFWTLVIISYGLSLVFFKEKIIKPVNYVLVTFFLFRILFYATPWFPGLSHFNSGSRILMHVYPVAVFHILIVMGKYVSIFQKKAVTSAG